MIDSRLLSDLKARMNFIPSCNDYYNLLHYARARKGMSMDKLRSLMVCKTYAEWADFLNVV